MRISDWSSDVCSSDLSRLCNGKRLAGPQDDALRNVRLWYVQLSSASNRGLSFFDGDRPCSLRKDVSLHCPAASGADGSCRLAEGAMVGKSEEHTSELQSLIRISYAVFCLKIKTRKETNHPPHVPDLIIARNDDENMLNPNQVNSTNQAVAYTHVTHKH